MPTPLGDYSTALREAFVTNPADVQVLHTLEFQHPSFVDDNNDPIGIRVVNDFVDGGHNLPLEADAPLNAGETVNFMSLPFTVDLPDRDPEVTPTLKIASDNAARYLMPLIKDAIVFRADLKVIYRAYIKDESIEPEVVMRDLRILTADTTASRVTMTASYIRLIDKPFPKKVYTTLEFPALI